MNSLDKNTVAAHFSIAARNYEQHAVLQKLVTERLLSRLDLVKIRPKWVVDAGSGSGFSARALRKKYRTARILQIDLAPAMLVCSRRKSWPWFSRQYYACTDAESLPVTTGRIDLVFSSLMLQWCNDTDRTFAETKRILKPNGLYIFATLGPETLRELRECWASIDDGEHVHSFPD
ncbi:MAG: methyltransferase domain-containing protein, partial [Gammaproteobacteria bacterium]